MVERNYCTGCSRKELSRELIIDEGVFFLISRSKLRECECINVCVCECECTTISVGV